MEFDVVLVVEYFRTLAPYLSIVAQLSQRHRIGIYCLPVPEREIQKNRRAQEAFVERLVQLGATNVSSRSVRARLLVVPQRPYQNGALDEVRAKVSARRAVALLTLGWPGNEAADQFLTQFAFEKVMVVDRKFFDFLIEKRGAAAHYVGRDLVEVGMPFAKYPAFEEFSADYFLAIPTPFSFAHEDDKWCFLETVRALLDRIPETDVIVHKPHNGLDIDQFASPTLRRALVVLRFFVPLVAALKGVIAKHQGLKVLRWLGRLYTAYLYDGVLRRTVPIEKVTPHYQYAMEAFMPGIRKGVIGGLSNTIWGTLFYRLPFYNCVDLARQRRDDGNKTYGNKVTSNALDLNLTYFHVPYCRGELAFDSKYFDLIADSTRDGDMIAEIERELSRTAPC
jgi:hypothetical protein